MNTPAEPLTITSGGPTQISMSVTRAAGRLPIKTVGQHGAMIGPPTWGTSTVTIGQTWLSVMRAAGGIILFTSDPTSASSARLDVYA